VENKLDKYFGGDLMKNISKALIPITCLLAGIVIGFLISPVKGGFGNNSGNTINYYGDKKEGSENSENN